MSGWRTKFSLDLLFGVCLVQAYGKTNSFLWTSTFEFAQINLLFHYILLPFKYCLGTLGKEEITRDIGP